MTTTADQGNTPPSRTNYQELVAQQIAREDAAEREAAERAARARARQRAQDRADALTAVFDSSGIVKFLGWIVVVLGTLAGIVLCVYHTDEGFSGDTHPFLGVGIPLAFFSLLFRCVGHPVRRLG